MKKIFLETGSRTTSEYVFVSALLNKIKGEKWKDSFRIIALDGKDNIRDSVNIFFDEGDNFVIFDADYPKNGGGFKKRQKELLEIAKQFDISFELFLFPNNSDDGDFEALLDKITNPIHSSVKDCFNKYEFCIRSNSYHSPDAKAKMFAYISSQNLSNNDRRGLGKGKWMFENPSYWNLDSKELKPLISFIESI